jgi:N-sulfoglucosamine sulfohydrolase
MNMQKSIILTSLIFLLGCSEQGNDKTYKFDPVNNPPNILFAISDDQSFPHASAYGSKMVNTPAFDRVAADGILFMNAFVASPGCSPSRAAILTGRFCGQIEDAGTHAAGFPAEYIVYPDILEKGGYFIGYTYKGWGPGNWHLSGRIRNPAGVHYNNVKHPPPFTGFKSTDYAGNFADFISQKPEGKPFYFWYGCSEPHRDFEEGSGLRAGKKLEDAEVPPFLPDSPEIRSDLLDYALEIEWFDKHLGRMIKMLEETGELDNTIIVVTSDNGMAFPRAKSNLYEYGIHMPLTIMWGKQVKGGRTVDDIINLIDLAPTFLEAAGLEHPSKEYPMAGRSIMNILLSNKEGQVDSTRTATFSAKERHSSARWNNHTYPMRSIRTQNYLYIRNFKPERWPAGAPQEILTDGTSGPMHGAYYDIDASPSLSYLTDNHDHPEVSRYFHLAVDKRPAEELYDILSDPGCLQNLANEASYQDVLTEHRRKLGAFLMETEDPRVTGRGNIYEEFPRYGSMREFQKPDWVNE